MFAFEEVASSWTPELTVMLFSASLFSSLTCQFLNSAFEVYPGDNATFATLEAVSLVDQAEGHGEEYPLTLGVFPIAVVIGVLCGLFSVLWTLGHPKTPNHPLHSDRSPQVTATLCSSVHAISSPSGLTSSTCCYFRSCTTPCASVVALFFFILATAAIKLLRSPRLYVTQSRTVGLTLGTSCLEISDSLSVTTKAYLFRATCPPG
jgi:hypothetical protein